MDQVHVVILAAGLGTRMKSKKAKVLHEAGGLTIVEHVIRAATHLAPPENITLVVGHQAERVQAAMQHYGVRFALQSEQKGTGHALLCAGAEGKQHGHTIVLYGDTPLLTIRTLDNLLNQQRTSDAAGTVITTVVDDPTGYGRIVLGADESVRAIVEQKAASPEQLQIREINSGIYCFKSSELWPELERLQPNPASGEVYLTDLVEAFGKRGLRTARYLLADSSELLGINNRVELAQADRILRARKCEQLMLAGVTIESPETVVIDPDVEVGQDTVIGPYVHLLGKTRVGAECHVAGSAVLKNALLHDHVVVNAFSHVDSCELRKGAHIGPFARLRNHSVLDEDAHVGNFVELKNARLAEGVKAGHLTYLGDCTVGARTNVGAGTITCNYDGFAKHQTTIGANVFVGSNSTLVAPVTLGDGAITAAGSVITQEVPADALAFGRAKQENKEGRAKERRERMAAAKRELAGKQS